MTIAMPLSVSGRWIVDANGRRVKLCGVNWAGAHQDQMVPGGLDCRRREDIAATIAGWGFNSVRFPFALATVTASTLVNPALISANPDLAGRVPWSVYEACVHALTGAGLMVIPNCHILYPGWPVPETTQILTRSGWKHAAEVRPGEDETLGYQDGELIWTPITQVQRRGAQKVIRFGSGRWSTVCTPDHRWLVQQAFPRNRVPKVEWGPVRAESAYTAWHSKQESWHSKRVANGMAGSRRLVLTGYAEGGKSQCTPDEARLLAWILSDGNITIRRTRNAVRPRLDPSRRGSYQAYIAQSAAEHADEIRALVIRTGFLSSEITRRTGHGSEVCLFRLKNTKVRELWRYLDGGFIQLVLTLGQEARAAWFDAWRKAEGSGTTVCQNPGPKLDAIALTAFLEGYLPQPITGKRHRGVRLMSSADRLFGAKTINNGPNANWIYEDAGTEDVWCPTTGLGSWAARDKDGRIFITGNCCSDTDGNGLWHNEAWPSSVFTNDWLTAAAAFADNPLVVGYDIKNEPRNATIGGTLYRPSWGDGNGDTDFRQLYSNTATRIQAVDRDALFFCEGLSYAADLTAAGSHPVTPQYPGKVVYSMHDYAWFHPSGQSAAAYAAQMDASGGYLMRDGTAPVWVGEFGTGNEHRDLGPWFAAFTAWAADTDCDWAWWMLDGTMRQGTTPQTNVRQCAEGDRAGFGLFAQDWLGPSNPVLLEALQSLMPARLGPGVVTPLCRRCTSPWPPTTWTRWTTWPSGRALAVRRCCVRRSSSTCTTPGTRLAMACDTAV